MTVSALVDLLCRDHGWRGLAAARQFLRQPSVLADRLTLFRLLKSDLLVGRADFKTREVRLAIACDASLENLVEPLLFGLLERGMFGRLHLSSFGQMAQEVRDSSSGIFLHGADAVVLAPLTAFWSRDVAATPALAEQLVDEVWSHVSALRDRYDGLILLINLLMPDSRPQGILDPRASLGCADFVRLVNMQLAQRCLETGKAFIIDAEALSARCGLNWTGLHKQYFMTSRPIADGLATQLAADIAAFCAALKGYSRKCLVVDLDNTLWGGLVGEDGVMGLKLGGSFPGNLYTALQREIRTLHKRGVMLAIVSKNNESDVWEVFEHRSEMVLGRGDFTAHRINWQDKAMNLREIAREMNLGLDAFVMLDDNRVERAWIEESLPEVDVCPAGDPLEMLRWITNCRHFDTLAISREDSLRAASYAAAGERSRLVSQSGNLAEYLASLEMILDIRPITNAQLARVAQLTQKTNQFNLTTRRYTESQVQDKMNDPAWRVFYCACRDRFADEGIIGVAFVQVNGTEWRLDTFMISCRVLGRGVEKAFLDAVCECATAEGALTVRGEYLRTAKNGQAENFFELCGFVAEQRTADQGIWHLHIPAPVKLKPSWIEVRSPETV